jgi:translation initiation factor 5A
MVIEIKGQNAEVTDVQELKSKRGGLKFKITGKKECGTKVTLTKPGDRQVVIISGGDHLSGGGGKKKKRDADVVDDKDYSIQNTAAGASKTVPIRAGEVRKGGYVMLKGKPCKVVEVSISKTGKHGHAKANITGLDVFTGRKYVEISPTSHNMTAPTMFRSEYQMVSVNRDGEMELMDAVGTMNNLLRLPKDTHGEFTALSQRIMTKHNEVPEGRAVFVTVLKAMDTEQVVDFIVKEEQT